MAFSKSESAQNSNSVSGETVSIIGGVPVGDATTMEGFAAWADTVTLNPMPIQYSFMPISEVAMAVVMARETYDPKGNPVRVEPPEPEPETESLPHSAAPSPAPSRAPGRPPRHRPPPSAAEAAPDPEARAEPDEIPSTVATAESRVSAQQNLQSEALRFIAAYAYFLDDYGNAGLQQPFLDEASQELELNGGVCVDDPTLGDGTVYPEAVGNTMIYPTSSGYDCLDSKKKLIDWRRCKNEVLEDWCYAQCFSSSTIGTAWESVGSSRPADRFGNPVGNELYAPKLVKKLEGGAMTLSKAEYEDFGLIGMLFNDFVRSTTASGNTYYRPDLKAVSLPNVAMEFVPAKGGLGADQGQLVDPYCKCFTQCPAMHYDTGSVNKTSGSFGRKLRISCNKRASTSTLCNPDSYNPWPKLTADPLVVEREHAKEQVTDVCGIQASGELGSGESDDSPACAAAKEKLERLKAQKSAQEAAQASQNRRNNVRVQPPLSVWDSSWGKRNQGGTKPRGAYAWFLAGNSEKNDESNINLSTKRWYNLNQEAGDATLAGDGARDGPCERSPTQSIASLSSDALTPHRMPMHPLCSHSVAS